jgi:hypothetical protein
MCTISEVKEFLDKLAEKEQSPAIASTLRLSPAQMTEVDCQYIDKELGIRLPESYRSLLLAYDWSNLRLGNLHFFSSAHVIIENNLASKNPFYEFYKANHLIEIGYYEADTVCVRLQNHGGLEGEIVYLNHARYPEMKAEFVSSSFERLVICAVIDLRLKKEANYYEWSDSQLLSEGESLYSQIMDAILKIEPRANEVSFWRKFIRGF